VVDGRRCKVWRAHGDGSDRGAVPGTLDERGLVVADGTLVLEEVQPEGKRRMAYGDWRHGAHPDGALTVDAG
jgi:methionyl-tRNA formyltransferase